MDELETIDMDHAIFMAGVVTLEDEDQEDFEEEALADLEEYGII